MNFPAIASAKAGGDAWARYASSKGIGSFEADTWLRGYVYLLVSSFQWAAIGAFVLPAMRRRREAGRATHRGGGIR